MYLTLNSDLSRKSIPSVTALSSSAWNPLLNSTLNRIEPIIDRWRGSLDVLLVFVSACLDGFGHPLISLSGGSILRYSHFLFCGLVAEA